VFPHGRDAYATAAVRSAFFARTALRLSAEAPVGTIMPQAPSSAPSTNSSASSRALECGGQLQLAGL
jgi:hypothetical protein